MEISELAYIQAMTFRKSGQKYFDSRSFIADFMAGPAGLLDKCPSPARAAEICQRFLDGYSHKPGTEFEFECDGLFWIGYLYRIWQARSGMASAKLWEIADPGWLYHKFYMRFDRPPHLGLLEICREKGLP